MENINIDPNSSVAVNKPATPCTMQSAFVIACIMHGRLAKLNATETRKLKVAIRPEYLAARAKHDERAVLKSISSWESRTKSIVPLSEDDRDLALRLAKTANPRRRNWEEPEAGDITYVQKHNNGRYSCRCSYNRFTYTPFLKSFAILSRWGGGAILYRHHSYSKFIRAPKGWRWDVDANGLRLVSRINQMDDFHPASGDLIRGSKHLLNRAVILREKRRKEASLARKGKALLLRRARGVRVCLQDSIDAGNCNAGSLTFAARHGLDPKGYYSAAMLFRLEPGNDRLELAVAFAIRRHSALIAAGTKVRYPRLKKVLKNI